jgi:hypothetical protein
VQFITHGTCQLSYQNSNEIVFEGLSALLILKAHANEFKTKNKKV